MLNYTTLPNPRMQGGLERYFEHGIQPGDFLTALLCNDLRGCVERADDTNMALLPDWVRWLYNEAPSPSWGSRERMDAWMDKREPVNHDDDYGSE